MCSRRPAGPPTDPRKTHFGSFIRKFSLDELPQFFNVLKGICPSSAAAEVPYHVEHFKEEIPRYLVRQQVRPGCTGWAQIHGLRGDTDIASASATTSGTSKTGPWRWTSRSSSAPCSAARWSTTKNYNNALCVTGRECL